MLCVWYSIITWVGGWHGHPIRNGYRAAGLPENLRKIKWNIWIKVFFVSHNETYVQIFSSVFLKISGRATALRSWRTYLPTVDAHDTDCNSWYSIHQAVMPDRTNSLILYAPCIILQYVYKPTRCTKFLWSDFIFVIRSTCFGLHLSIFRNNLFINCMSYLVCANMSGCCNVVPTTSQWPDVLAHTKYNIQFIKSLFLKMDKYSPKHVGRITKIKSDHKNFVHLVGLYTY